MRTIVSFVATLLAVSACAGSRGLDGAAGPAGPAGPPGTPGVAGDAGTPAPTPYQASRVLLISVDGMHQVDLQKWIDGNPTSALAALAKAGIVYSNARTTTPSDSFPGLLALVTGGTPKSTGVYYDDSYDRTMYPPGSDCSGTAGSEIVYDETVDHDVTKLFSGGIDPVNLPRAKDAAGNCKPVYPHSFLRVNTIFEVAKAAGLATAWSDKHPSYDLVNGPSGAGVDDLYTPEINSKIANGGTVQGVNLAATAAACDATNSLGASRVSIYTDCIPSQLAYDDVKVQAVINWIDGRRSDGGAGTGVVPAIFGMNFQGVSVAQKLPVGGYNDAAGTPSAQLQGAIAHTDASIGKMVAELKAKGLYGSTLIIVTAKHGQSPIDKTKLAMEGGGNAPVQNVVDPLGFVNAANSDSALVDASCNPNGTSAPGCWDFAAQTNGDHTYANHGHVQTDDVALVWLQNQTSANVSAVLAQLTNNAAAMHADTLPAGTRFNASIASGSALANLFGDSTSTSDPVAAARAPDLFIQPNEGVIYSGSSKKIAEHGGGTLGDTQVALLVSAPGLTPATISAQVSTTAVAPTILKALGLEPLDLQAVQKEATPRLPGIF